MADRDVPEGLTAWAAVADELEWAKDWTSLYQPLGELGRWFVDGRLNVAVNCVDRHLAAGRGELPAIRWEGEPGDSRTMTYAELGELVRTLAGALRGLGVGVGDRVALHLGWLPETVGAMLACARIGATYTVLPTPLPVEALAERLEDFGPRVLFTQDGAWRHGTIIPLKLRADDALTAVGGVEHTIVVRRTGIDVGWYEGDRWLSDLLATPRPGTPAPDTTPADLDADHVLCTVPLANRKGRPCSVLQGGATLLASVVAIHRHGMHAGGAFWCAADIAWMGTQAHGVLGPLACGDTAVMYEGMLDVPSWTRTWDIIRRHDVRTLLTTPSVIRHLRDWSPEPPPPETLASLRRVVLIGEPSDPELVDWLAGDVGRGRLSLDDAWGQIELGGVTALLASPADPDLLPDPGLAIVDEEGRDVPDGEPGELALRRPWAGMMRGMEGVGAGEVVRGHWRLPGVYLTEDTVRRRPDGRMEFLGRIDEVISVSGQLVSLGEVREVLLDHPFVADADVVQRADRRLGRSLAAAVVPAAGVTADAELARELLDAVRDLLGGLARPRTVLFVDRFGDELTAVTRRRALAALATLAADEMPVQLAWEQVVAAHASRHGGTDAAG